MACTYCYMYDGGADNRSREQPRVMNDETLQATAQRVQEHMGSHALRDALVVLHGGEPLLADRMDRDYYRRAVGYFREHAGATAVRFFMQTNGTLLTRDVLDRFKDLRIRIGVSLDGTEEINDRTRRYHNGTGSYREATRGLRLLRDPKYQELYGTMLCVINLESDPVRTYETLARFHPPAIEFIMPHANWSAPPPGYSRYIHNLERLIAKGPMVWQGSPDFTKYADWLLPIYYRWLDDQSMPNIPLFHELVGLATNSAPGALEYIGPGTPDAITVETNGAIEDVDTMKSTAPGQPELGLDVFNNSFNEALAHPKVRARQLSKVALSKTCRRCAFRDMCSGGYFVHRYAKGSNPDNPDRIQAEFANPSVYCVDLAKLTRLLNQQTVMDIAK